MNEPGLYQAIESIIIGGGKSDEFECQLTRKIIASAFPRIDLFFCYAFQHSPEHSPSLSFLFWKVAKLPYSLYNYQMAVSMLIQRLEAHLTAATTVASSEAATSIDTEISIYRETVEKLKTML